MFELYKSPLPDLGTCVEVHIDHINNIIKRQYKYDAITVNGNMTKKSPQEIDSFFDNEIYWLSKLQSEWIPKTLDIDKENKTILQEFTGDCLLYSLPTLHKVVPDIEEQIIEMYKFFKKNNVFKCNGSLSNLTLNKNQLVAFDFKWAEHRPNNIEMELKSYDVWLSKIDKNLSIKLKELL
jgi:RIO-like serine/threonine protein kinase